MLKPVIARFFRKISVSNNFYNGTPCWNWIGGKTTGGYGIFWFNKKIILAHRFSYEYYKVEIPKSLQIDHLCRVRGCCNPNHLEVVTLQENIRRGLTGKINSYNKGKSYCVRGHEFTTQNIYRKSNNRRVCKICSRIRHKKFQDRPKNKSKRKEYEKTPKVIAQRKEYRSRPEIISRRKERQQSVQYKEKEEFIIKNLGVI